MEDTTDQKGSGPPVLKLVRSDGEAVDGSDAAIVDDGDETERATSETVEPVKEQPGSFPASDNLAKLRILEAMLFASPDLLSEAKLAERMDPDDDVNALMAELQRAYEGRGVELVKVAGRWGFRTAEDLGFLLERHAVEERRLSKAALETLAIVAYHQPVTRAEIEEIRGVSTSAGTLDILLETGWVRLRGRRRAPGRPVTYGTSEAFLEHFSLENIKDLPGLADLKGAGLLDSTLPANFTMPQPTDVAALMPDELPLEDDDPDGVATQDEFDLDDRGDDEGSDVGADVDGFGAEDLPEAAPADKPEA